MVELPLRAGRRPENQLRGQQRHATHPIRALHLGGEGKGVCAMVLNGAAQAGHERGATFDTSLNQPHGSALKPPHLVLPITS